MSDSALQPLLERLTSQNAITSSEAGIVSWWWTLERRPQESLEEFLERKHLLDPPEMAALREGRPISEEAAEQMRMTLRALVERGDDGSLITQSSMARSSSIGKPGSSILTNSALVRRSLPGGEGLPTIQPGSRLGIYQLTERLGQGTHGIVFRGMDTIRQMPVAVKVLRPQFRSDPAIYAQLQAEIRIIMGLEHPNLTRILHLGEEGETAFLVMEYVEGLSLAELIKQTGYLRLDKALNIVNQIVLGLAHAHAAGVLHRDIKPANILINREGAAKLVDLGLNLTTPVSDSTATGRADRNAMPWYLSPEAARSFTTADHRSDMYALGAVFYHALTGRPPFDGGSRIQLLMRHLRELPVPPHDIRPELPVAASVIVLRMLAKKPEERYTTYDELAIALVDLLVSIESGPVRMKDSAMTPVGLSYSSVNRRVVQPPSRMAPETEPVSLQRQPEPIPPPDPSRMVKQILRDGIAAAKSGDRPKAAGLFRQATSLDPNSELAWLWLAGVVDNAEESIPCLQRALEINPDCQQASDALTWYQSTMPHLFDSWECLICGHRCKRPRERCPHCNSVVSLEFPNALLEPQARTEIVVAQISRLEEQARRVPSVPAYRALGLALLNLNRFDEGMQQLMNALKLQPDDEEFSKQIQIFAERHLLKRAVAERVLASMTLPPALGRPLLMARPDSATVRRIFVLHERLIIRLVMEKLLARQGYVVYTAPDLQTMFEQLKVARPSLILLNFHFPSYNSLELCEMFRNDPRTADAPVVVIANPGVAPDRVLLRDVGVSELIVQPFDPRDLVELVSHLCPRL
ncbi:serine/threonine-protein kinase [Tuwongella immobilis]|uniref:Uncharacterized protein n=1 Tax=Tuwongella immobilis TaxID=692036 RepID=A0A6C2YJP9_9BACT|nr:serine/threonine-protein kinase [Tuwongella immobilis]VIP01798.1 serine threonine protein kinase : Serine/threonine protein kinase OS=Isosphaera pallida (strain ATCC 43644 / DSM 9630 / IS1B) GN=Isop_3637 PE=3 SV=1: Pkinase: TPR_2: Response_reg [Tuwongella immobilis]VTR99483.1 serine threonine protein kinase : Serine/threonine protein kinase OS=Isosphaera pallida (strain ATCC 43644 / DSM 9630 / IS1B) GN=Isop_3637 PE=3 SV=1: Pkinase: TPR_2: Response_reg [Tuwongella immobilis]